MIYTDHNNLQFEHSKNPRIIRWRLLIEEFSPIIKFIEGKNNIVADALSRLPIAMNNATQDSHDVMINLIEKYIFPLDFKYIMDKQREAKLETSKTLKQRQVDKYKILC